MLSFLISLVISETLVTDLGVHHCNYKLDNDLIINITYYPFYIIFWDIPNTTTYYEFYSRSPTRINPRNYVSDGGSLPVYRAIELPYGQINFSSTRADTVEFTYVSMPGICRTGLYLSASSFEDICLSNKGTGFYEMEVYDDKCFIFAYPGEQPITLDFSGSRDDEVVYLYNDYYNYTSYNNIQYRGKLGNVAIRVVTGWNEPKSKLSIKLEGTGKTRRSAIHIPRHTDPGCRERRTWYSADLIITLLTASGFLLAINLIMIIAKVRQCSK